MNSYSIIINLDVKDQQELFKAAVANYCEENGGDPEDNGCYDMLKPDGEMDVAACLIQLADPGMSWPGTQIYDTTAEQVT